MIKALVFNLITILSSGAFSQKYEAMLGEKSLWNITSFHVGYQSDTYYAEGDTLISGLDYKFLNGFHYMRNAMLREDTVERKIYYWQKEGFRAGEDILLYDFSLTEGDSMLLYNPNTPMPDSAGYFVLDSISEVNVINGKRRKFFLSRNGTSLAEWIEGIGSTGLLTASATKSDLPNGFELACFQFDSLNVYASDLATSFGTCTFQTVGTEDVDVNQELIIYPNPASGFITISNIAGEDLEDIRLYDMTGRQAEIAIRKNAVQVIVDLTNLPGGIYCLHVITDLKLQTAIIYRQ